MDVTDAAPAGDLGAIGATPEQILQAVVDASLDAVIICDAEGRVATWGEPAARLFGHSAGATLGIPLTSLFPDHVRAEVAAAIARVGAGEGVVRVEGESVRDDGMPVPLSLSLCSIAGARGERLALVAVLRDVTEQRVAQATLAEAEMRLNDGEALAHVGSWLWDVRTGAVQWSAEFHRLHGVDPLDFGGTLDSYLEVVHSDDRSALRAAMEGSIASGRPFELEYQVTTPQNGAGARVLVRAQPIVGMQGTVVGLRGVGRTAPA